MLKTFRDMSSLDRVGALYVLAQIIKIIHNRPLKAVDVMDFIECSRPTALKYLFMASNAGFLNDVTDYGNFRAGHMFGLSNTVTMEKMKIAKDSYDRIVQYKLNRIGIIQ